MSFAVDVNVLLSASNPACKEHKAARAFLERSIAGDEIVCVAWATLMSYLRIATHAGIFPAPLTPQEARANVVGLLGLPNVRALSEGDGFWESYEEVTRGVVVRGNLVSDAHLVAVLHQSGVRVLYSNDADFRLFPLIELRDPLAA